MTARRTHIVGAGIAGLSAALAVTADGGEAVLYEAAPQPGGRCRTLHPADGFVHDNGTHVLFTANTRALDLLKTIGARERWLEPEPEGLPVFDRPYGSDAPDRPFALVLAAAVPPSARAHVERSGTHPAARLRVEGLPCRRPHRTASHHGQPDRAAYGGSAQHTCRAGLLAAARPCPAPAHPPGRRAAPGSAEWVEPRSDRARRRHPSGDAAPRSSPGSACACF